MIYHHVSIPEPHTRPRPYASRKTNLQGCDGVKQRKEAIFDDGPRLKRCLFGCLQSASVYCKPANPRISSPSENAALLTLDGI
jgi:hypothetical protein